MTGIVTDNVGRSSGLIKAGSVAGGAWTKIKEQTASSSATISFVDGTSDVVLDNTYPIYVFKFINIHPATDGAHFVFQGNAAGESGYNETLTTTLVEAYHNESDSTTNFWYDTNDDLAQSTSFLRLMAYMDNDNDSCGSGELRLFSPSSTTFLTNFIAKTNYVNDSAYTLNNYIAGYFNTTAAIDEIQFKMEDDSNIDSGKIKLYGLSDS